MEGALRIKTKKKILFVALFAVLGFIALHIPAAQLAGSAAKFTHYDAFAPIAGAFIGSGLGVIAVLTVQVTHFLVNGMAVEDIGTVIRFAPMLFAVLYFAKKNWLNIIVPLVAILAFVAHPTGREVWYYALFWLIPIGAYFLRDRSVLIRALGATFSAHAVGGALWIWAFSLPAVVWQALIPVVAIERLAFAAGMAASFVVLNNLLFFLEKKQLLLVGFKLDPRYILPIVKRIESKPAALR